MRSFILVLMFVISAACTKNYHTVISGGQDSGGGTTTGSRLDVVKAHLIDMAGVMSEVDAVINTFRMKKKRDDSAESKIFYKFYDLLLENKIGAETDFNDDIISLRERRLARQGGRVYIYGFSTVSGQSHFASPTAPHSSFANNYDFHLDLEREQKELDLDSLEDNSSRKSYASNFIEFDIKESQPCLDLHNNPKAGAVEALDGSIIKICLSMSELQKIPESSLRTQIVALIIHEMSHLVGFLEAEAQNLQAQVVRHYELEMPKVSKPLTSLGLINSIILAQQTIEKYLASYNKQDFLNHLEQCNAYPRDGALNKLIGNALTDLNYFENSMFIEQYKQHMIQQSMIYSDRDKLLMQGLVQYQRILDEYFSILLANQKIMLDQRICSIIKEEDVDFMFVRLNLLVTRLVDQFTILTANDFANTGTLQF